MVSCYRIVIHVSFNACRSLLNELFNHAVKRLGLIRRLRNGAKIWNAKACKVLSRTISGKGSYEYPEKLKGICFRSQIVPGS